MNNNTENLKRTPLRNSNLANKPFRSPFSNNSTPCKGNSSKRQYATSVSCLKETSLNVQLEIQQKKAIKRRKLNVEVSEPSNKLGATKNDLLALKQRIKNKKLEIDSLKIKLAYRKKHNAEHLRVEIQKWQQALQKALIQYQEDCKQKYIGGNNIDMKGILLMLGIPEGVATLLDIEDNF